MLSPRRHVVARLLLGVAALLAAVAPAAAQCPPAACAATAYYLNFESLSPGSAVEGLGTVHPLLNITHVAWPFGPSCGGNAFAIENGVTPAAYGTGTSTPNGCLTTARGFGDSTGCVLNYDFTFAPGVTVSCFSIRMLDFGDLYPFGVGAHQVSLTGYNASNAVVDVDLLSTTGPVDLVGGDACTSGPNGSGNHLFTVTGPGMVRVELRFDPSPDPNVGFDDISFCALVPPTDVHAPTWGRLKTRYR